MGKFCCGTAEISFSSHTLDILTGYCCAASCGVTTGCPADLDLSDKAASGRGCPGSWLTQTWKFPGKTKFFHAPYSAVSRWQHPSVIITLDWFINTVWIAEELRPIKNPLSISPVFCFHVETSIGVLHSRCFYK